MTTKWTRPASATVATLLIAWPLCGRGQTINEYVNPLVEGLDIQPGVTVQSRLHPEYDPVGIHSGLVTVLPRLDESIGYDDNVTGTSSGRGSLRIETDAKINAKAATNDSAVNLTIDVDDLQFPELSNQSYTNWNANLSASHQFGNDELFASATHYNQNQSARDIDLPQLDHPIAFRLDDLIAQYTINRGHLQIQPVMDLQFYGFDNGTVLGTRYLQTSRDRTVYLPSVSATYEFADRRRAVVVFRDANALYYSGFLGQPKQSFNDFSLLAGLAYDLDGLIGFRLLGGYEERDFSSRAYGSIRAPIVEGSVTWTPSGLTTFTGTVSRLIEDSASDGTIATTDTKLQLRLDHELYRNVILDATFGFNASQYAQTEGSRNLFRAGAGVAWLLNRSLRLRADYAFATRRRSGSLGEDVISSPLATFGQNYSENIVTVGLRLAI